MNGNQTIGSVGILSNEVFLQAQKKALSKQVGLLDEKIKANRRRILKDGDHRDVEIVDGKLVPIGVMYCGVSKF